MCELASHKFSALSLVRGLKISLDSNHEQLYLKIYYIIMSTYLNVWSNAML